jgi:hypothetical protein
MNSPEAIQLSKDVSELLFPIMKREFDAGYNPAEIYNLICSAVNLELSELTLIRAIELRKSSSKSPDTP